MILYNIIRKQWKMDNDLQFEAMSNNNISDVIL